MRNGFKAFDFGDQPWFVFVGLGRNIAQLAGHFHVGGIFWKADGHVVGLERHGGFDVFHVFAGQRRCGQPAALFVDALVVGEFAAHLHHGVHLFAFDFAHGQHDQPIVEQQQVAGFDVARKFFVIEPHAEDIAGLGARSVEHKRSAGLQHHFAFGEFANADFGPLQVGHDGHDATGAFGGFSHQRGSVNMVLRLAMAEIESNHIDAGADHGFKNGGIAGSWPQRGDDFGGVLWHGQSEKRACIVTRER